jgi:hypothetical protein
MNKFGIGIKAAFLEILFGFLTALVLNDLVNTGQLPSYSVILISLIIIIGILGHISNMGSWDILYTLGWLFGSFILFNSGLLEPLDIILYIVFPIVLFIIRIYREFLS